MRIYACQLTKIRMFIQEVYKASSTLLQEDFLTILDIKSSLQL